MDDQEFNHLKSHIYKLTRLNLDGYKVQQVRRRLEGYVERTVHANVQEFCRILDRDPNKRRELIDYLAINVSEFFRDINQFSFLKTNIIPELKKKKARLNIWSAACSCGQEPYSLAMYLEEQGCNYRILATDIDASALEKARNGGPYTDQDIRNVEPHYQKIYFTHDATGHKVRITLARNIDFKSHNIHSDSFLGGYDLIVCRNAIIYFSEPVRDEIFKKFFSSLNHGGYLFIGGSEAILNPNKIGFKTVRPSYYLKPREEQLNVPLAALKGDKAPC